MWRLFGVLLLAAACSEAKCPNQQPLSTARLVCHYEGRTPVDQVEVCGCTHLVYTGPKRGDELKELSKKLIEEVPKLKILLRVAGKDKDVVELVKSSVIHGLDLYEAHNVLNRTKITTSTESIRSAIGSDAILMMSLPAQSELLAKYYDLKTLSKSITLFALETQNLGEIENETFHPSRLSGVWDMLNTDSVVDLTIGLGIPSAKIIINSPAKAYKFILKNNTLSTPGSPTTESKPTFLNQKELCSQINNGEKWTLERDQDLSAPYAFKDDKWLAFEDSSSLDVKGKYARIRSLGGMGLVSIDDDSKTECGISLLQTMVKALGSQSRAPRGAVLGSLEHEILSVPQSNRLVDNIQLSPYRISRVVDSDGVIHALREDTRTEFECQRQGYFVHPRTCNRFYRCVKFDQLSDEYTVFEFDCPAGLAFDSRWEVCVWPGSLSDAQACPGSSEIAPVPKTRFICPEKQGYYADPANCRWFFACLDHGKAPLSAYEFRCPFGLGFDESRLICDWPWLVPGCGNLGKYEASAYGHGSTVLTGASHYLGSSADSINIAGHQSLISGASPSNHVGIQSGYGSYHEPSNQGYAIVDNGASQIGDTHNVGVAYTAAPISVNYNNGGLGNGASYDSGSLGSGASYAAGNLGSGASYAAGNLGHGGAFASGNLGHGAGFATANLGHGATYSTGNTENDASYVAGNLGHGASYTSGNTGNGASYVAGNLGHGASYTSGNAGNGASYVTGSSNIHGASVASNSGYNGYSNYDANKSSGKYQSNGGNLVVVDGLANSHGASSFGSVYSGKQISDYDHNSGAYHHDNSGDYQHDNSGDYKHDYGGEYQDDLSAYKYGTSGSSGNYYNNLNANNGYQQKESGNSLYDNSGSYKYGGSYSYNNGGSNGNSQYYQNGGAYKHNVGYNAKENNVYVNHGSSGDSGSYRGDLNAYSGYTSAGAAHTLTAGAINAGLVGKTTLVDTGLYNGNAYSQNSGSSSNVVHNQGHDYNAYEYNSNIHQNSGAQSAGYYNQGESKLNVYTHPTVTVAPVQKQIQPIFVTPSSQTYTYSTTASPPKTHVKELFGVQPSAVSFVQPTVHVSSTPQSIISTYDQPSVSITSYSKPAAAVYQSSYNNHESDNSYQGNAYAGQSQYQSHGFVSSTPKVNLVSYQEPQVTHYVNPLVSIKNVSPAPTIASVSYVKQPTYTYQPTSPTVVKSPSLQYSGAVSSQNTVHYNNAAGGQYNYQNNLNQYQGQQYNVHSAAGESSQGYTYNQGSYDNSAYSKQQANSQSHQQVVSHVQYNPQPIVSSTAIPVANVQTHLLEPVQTHAYKGPEYLPPKQKYESPVVSVVSSTPSTVQYNQHSTIHSYDTVKQAYNPPVAIKPVISQGYVSTQPTYQQSYSAIPIVSSTPAPVVYKQAAVVQTYNTNDHLEYAPQKIQYVQPKPVSSTPAVVHFEKTFNYQLPKVQQQYVEISNTPTTYLSSPAPFTYNKQSASSFQTNTQHSSHVTEHKSYNQQQQNYYENTGYQQSQQYQPIISSTYSPSTYKTVQSSTHSPINHYSSSSYVNLQPVVSSTYSPVQSSSYTPIKYETSTYKPIEYQSSSSFSNYNNEKYNQKVSYPSSTYKASTYLPPVESSTIAYKVAEVPLVPYKSYSTTPQPIYQELGYQENIEYNQYQQGYDSSYNQQSEIVVKKPDCSTANPINLLGFGTVGPNAGLISPPVYSSAQPSYSTESVIPVTRKIIKIKPTTSAPYIQKVVEVTPPVIRKTRPKVAVVTKVNDFNPLLVRKLGAVCSCRSNVLRLRKPKPDYNTELEYDVEYDNDYAVPVNGDNDEEWTYKSGALKYEDEPVAPIVIKKPKVTIVSSTLKPIIVPDEPQYYDEYSNSEQKLQPIIVKEEYDYPVVKTTNVKIISDDQDSYRAKPVQIRKKIKAVTIAPTIATVLIPESQSKLVINKQTVALRNNDETPQGAIDCQRVGLFRHPKHCNKFYSCRWDCMKKKFTLHVFNCPIQLSFDPSLGACNWPSQGPACESNTLLPSGF